MNLLDRLSPDHLERLKAEEVKYPTTIKILMMELSDNTHFLDLTYYNILKLFLHLDLKDYSVTSLEKLFNHEKH
ncbi:hypothetical protein UFOVP950_10 [uncultured Caudovirales phage]|uniref:Uncharacterized protein n=1 Tax=uncultured Caudovirales phage TaxID=2100421 RepID=A0A6J5PZU1_9CAUD|nr:hypothetical protein UFOVP950_10 [uncultured Caudovirales phage]